MLGNGIKQTSTTTGTGALALSAVGGSVKFSQSFVLNRAFAYSIYTGGDSAPVFREAGIGYLSDANTMVRSSVTATFDGTTYNATNPTATDFGGAAITVVCTPHAATVESMLPTVDSISSGTNRYLTSAARSLTTTTAGIVALRVYYVPFLLRVGGTISSLAINVTVAGGSGSTARAGIYVGAAQGYPGALLATTGDIDISATGLKTPPLTSTVMLPPGWYFVAVVGSASATINCYTSSGANEIGGSPFGFNSSMTAIDFRFETVGTAVLPATANATTSASNVGVAHVPLVYMGVQ